MTTLSHKNLTAHNFLTDQGACVHLHHEAEHGGDAENGPGKVFPAWDEYDSESHFIVIDDSGLIVHTEMIDWDLLAWLEDREWEADHG